MPFVFVHGVNSRRDADYGREEQVRAAFLREIVAPAAGIDARHPIYAPYWGDDGVRFWHDLAVIPKGSEMEPLTADDQEPPPSLGLAMANGTVQAGDTLDAVARRSPDTAVDLLFDAVIQQARSQADILAVARAYRLAQNRLADTAEPWSAQTTMDGVLEQVLAVVIPMQAAGGEEAFHDAGLRGMLEEGAKRLILLGPDQISHAFVLPLRRPLTRKAATLMGDTFRYLAERGDGATPGPIAATILQSLRQAHDLARSSREPLVVICHSFGAEIVYDILTHYAEGSDLEVDAWVTVGAQVGLFEEMSLLWTSPGRTDRNETPHEAIASPKRAKRWLNILDTNDLLGFLVLPTFTGTSAGAVQDFKYDTGRFFIGAHSGYFKWPSFYKRLAQRIGETM